MFNMQPTTANEFLQSWASVVFFSITVGVSLNLSYSNNLFLWGNGGDFWYKCIHHCTWRVKSYGVRSISYNADRAPYDIVRCPAGHRPIESYTDAGRRPYNTWPRKRKILKIVRCPGDYQFRRWCANRWYRTMSVLFVTIA